MPQALDRVPHTLEPHRLLERADLAARIAEISVWWALIEENLNGLLISMLFKGELATSGLIREMFKGIINIDVRFHLLVTVGGMRLSKTLYEDLKKLLKQIRRRAGERNDYIHRQWAISSQYPDALIRLPTEAERKIGHKAPKFMVYKERDFLATIDRLQELNTLILDLSLRCMKSTRPAPKRSRARPPQSANRKVPRRPAARRKTPSK